MCVLFAVANDDIIKKNKIMLKIKCFILIISLIEYYFFR